MFLKACGQSLKVNNDRPGFKLDAADGALDLENKGHLPPRENVKSTYCPEPIFVAAWVLK